MQERLVLGDEPKTVWKFSIFVQHFVARGDNLLPRFLSNFCFLAPAQKPEPIDVALPVFTDDLRRPDKLCNPGNRCPCKRPRGSEIRTIIKSRQYGKTIGVAGRWLGTVFIDAAHETNEPIKGPRLVVFLRHGNVPRRTALRSYRRGLMR